MAALLVLIPNREGGMPLSAWFLVTYSPHFGVAIYRGLEGHPCLNN